MFKIKLRRKKKDQPAQDVQPADPTKSIAHSVLKVAVLHRRWQEMLVQCAAAVPNHLPALTPLIEAALTPSVADLIAHAKQHGLITDEEAAELIKGHVRTFDLELKECV